jgi:hypothetical protein
MATDPRQNFDPNELLSKVAADFETLAAVLQSAIEDLSRPSPDTQALSHLQRARQAALRGNQLTKAAAEQRAQDGEA